MKKIAYITFMKNKSWVCFAFALLFTKLRKTFSESSFLSKNTKFMPYFWLAIPQINLEIENFDISGKAKFVILKENTCEARFVEIRKLQHNFGVIIWSILDHNLGHQSNMAQKIVGWLN